MLARETEAADDDQEQAPDKDRGHDTPPREWGSEHLPVQGVEPAADVGRSGHGQPVGRPRPRRPQGQPCEDPGVRSHIAKQVGGDGIADGVTRRRMRRADPPGQRVEPEQDRGDMGREVPGKVVIPRVCQFVGQDRPQVVGPNVVAFTLRQEQDGTPESGQAGGRRPPMSAERGPSHDIPAARRSSGILDRSRQEPSTIAG